MIEEFSFGNFRSFKNVQTLNMTAAKIKSSNPRLDVDNLIPINNKLSLLKSKAIYGANASGKSNIVKALGCFIKIIQESSNNENILILVDSFKLSTETENKPTFFELVFRSKDVRYRYGFEVDSLEIKSEWLFATPNLRELPLFIREGKKIIKIDKKHYFEGIKYIKLASDTINDIDDIPDAYTRSNALFLKSIALTGFGKESKILVEKISSIGVIDGLGSHGMHSTAALQLSKPESKRQMIDFLKYADVGIDDLSIIEISTKEFPLEINERNSDKQKLVVSKRIKFNDDLVSDGLHHVFPFYEESEGTQKMFELSPFIFEALYQGKPLIIDEFDARFHPLITKKIVELFNSNENKNSQLIFITHDTNLLSSELLRKDQIEFVEKDKFGASNLYSLLQFKGIRNNSSFEKDYLQGKYGAIPFLGNFNHIFKIEENA